MFEQYPKTRPSLSPEIAEVYARQYRSNRQGDTAASSASQSLEAWMHRQVARDVILNPGMKASTLEIGAGTLNQLPHEPDVGPYDIVEPFDELFEDVLSTTRIRHAWHDVSCVPPDARYDRITSIATFEHVCNLPEVVATCGILLAPGGQLRVGIPSEGTPLWTLGWRMTTGLEFRLRHGLDYGELMRHEHVNTAREVTEVLAHFFGRVNCTAFGLSRAISLYQFCECSAPVVARCQDYLQSRA
jgi:hypothetical protein